MIEKVLGMLGTWKKFNLTLQNFFLNVRSINFLLNNKSYFRLDDNENAYLEHLNLTIEKSCHIHMNDSTTIFCDKDIIIDGSQFVVNNLYLKQNNQLYNLYIDENNEIKVKMLC
jgi:hypothetical protein